MMSSELYGPKRSNCRHITTIACLLMLFAALCMPGCGDDSQRPPAASPVATLDISDLTVEVVSATSVSLSWTAPGDSEATRSATRYTVYFSKTMIQSGSLDVADTMTNPPVPQLPGTAESVQLTDLESETLYYFCVQAFGEDDDEIGISNVVSAETTGEPNPGGWMAIDGGTFSMGSPPERYGRLVDEEQHEVTLTHGFYMKTTEVTNSEYVELAEWAIEQGYCHIADAEVGYGWHLFDDLDGSAVPLLIMYANYSELTYHDGQFHIPEGKEDHPVIYVTWHGAAAYCDWLSIRNGYARSYDHQTWVCGEGDPYGTEGYRLPTEAEWEYACRAGTQTPFSTGDCLGSGDANYAGDEPYYDCPEQYWRSDTVRAGLLDPNPWGLFDMHGNVQEWCNDFYGPYNGDEQDPVGPSQGEYRVLRGGAWNNSGNICRSAFRARYWPIGGFTMGFRVVRSRG